MSAPRKPLRVGVAGLGAVGLDVARRLLKGLPGLTLAAVAVRDAEKLKQTAPELRDIPVLAAETLAAECDVVVEALPKPPFRAVAESVIDAGKIFVPLSVGQLLPHWDLVERAAKTGARIVVPTGALIGLDAVRAAAIDGINTATIVTRKPPNGLEGAPYLIENKISVTGLDKPLKVFDGSARDGARGFPANVNVAAALSLAGIGPDKTRLEIWADPTVTRNTHTVHVDGVAARFTATIENVPSDNPRTGRIVAPSTIAALLGLVAELKVGT